MISLERQMTAERDAKDAAAAPIVGWAAWPTGGGFELDAGPISLAVTDQSDRGCGWCWHVSAEHDERPDHILIGGGLASANAAKDAGIAAARAYCEAALAALSAVTSSPPPGRTSHTCGERDPSVMPDLGGGAAFIAEAFDAGREPLRAIRDLIVLCEQTFFERGDQAILERAQEAFTALRAMFGDNRPAEDIGEAAMIEPGTP